MAQVTVLGIAQDGGRPQAGCTLSCCQHLSLEDERHPVSLSLVDKQGRNHLFDISRALSYQLRFIEHQFPTNVWITHAHFGHIDGLGLLGKETMGLNGIHLHASASFIDLIGQHPFWNTMVAEGTLLVHEYQGSQRYDVDGHTSVTPLSIPHRAELSDMHGFVIKSHQSLLFLPDHDSWKATLDHVGYANPREWFQALNVDIVLIDGTFWDENELPLRDMKAIPHPTVIETLERLGPRQDNDPELYFLHLNHTNPLHSINSEQASHVRSMGWGIAHEGMRINLHEPRK